MSSTAHAAAPVPPRRFAGLRRPSLSRTGYLLVANSVLNAGTGVGYWLAAARLYPPAVVGVNNAAVSVMMLLAGIAQLNLMSALLRFVPTAGARAGRMVGVAYLVAGTLSGVAGLVFVAGLHFWAPHLAGLLGPGVAGMSFVVATMCWPLFVMQDSVLVALGRPGLVAVENLAFAVLKIVLVVALSLAVPAAGIWLSWTAAMVVSVAIVSGYIFGHALPAFARTRAPGTPVPVVTGRELGRFIGPDYVGGLAWIAATSLVPLLVLDLTNPSQSAAFALAWAVCFALYQVPTAFGQSLVAHGTLDAGRLGSYHRQALTQTLRLLVPVVALVVLFAPLGLRVFGHFYVVHSPAPLRLMALSALPNSVVSLAVSRARVARRMKTVVVVLAGLSVAVVGLTVVLVPRLGLIGGGIAWLTGQTVVAALLVTRSLIHRARRRLVRSVHAGVPGAVLAAALDSSHSRSERALSSLSGNAVVMVRDADGGPAVLKAASTGKGIAGLRHEEEVLRTLRGDERLGTWRDFLPVPLGGGDVEGGAYLLTSRLPGRDARAVRPDWAPRLTRAAVQALAPLHNLGRAVHVVDTRMLGEWVDEPAGLLRDVVGDTRRLDRLVEFLYTQLDHRWVTLGWTHGDFHPGNLLVEHGRVTGLVDWSQARERDLGAIDIAFWLLTVPGPGQRRELGARVAARLGRRNCWTPEEHRMLHRHMLGDPVSGQAILLLAWLRHVAGNIAKSERYAASPLWSRRNVIPVVRRVACG